MPQEIIDVTEHCTTGLDTSPDTGPAPAEPPPAKPPRFRRRKEARPDELIGAAIALFGEQGFAATNLRDVAKRAGVSKGTVYLYFKSKDDLLRAAIRTSIVPIVDAAEQLEVDAEGTAAALLRALMLQWVQTLEANGLSSVPKLIMAEAGNFPELAEDYVKTVLQRLRRLVARVLKRGVRNGEFMPLDIHQATHLLLAPVLYAQLHTAAFAATDPHGPELPGFLTAHLDLFLASIAAQETTP